MNGSSVAEAAELLGVTRQRIGALVARGKLRSYPRPGQRVAMRRAQLNGLRG